MYGILVVECDQLYQIIGEVSSYDEALELARNYKRVAEAQWQSPEPEDTIPPEGFVVWRRNENGRYTDQEDLNLEVSHA